ncbi:MAG: ankyrin repeat domain-containing protein [Bacteroidetes bacterium]|jgi:ankyrin repeat protein|nr:ankyrin repeat domain-containing protein [Bacteroidota bacterium]
MNSENFFDWVESNQLDAVKSLITSEFEINIYNKFGYSALHICCARDLNTMAELLINSAINVNLQDKDGLTALHYVATYGQLYLAELLLKNDGDLTIQDKYGNQPLWTATFNDKGRGDRFDMVKLFLDNGADPNHQNNVNKSPKDIVIIAGYKNLEKLFG